MSAAGSAEPIRLGHFWLWGFAPGKHKIIVYCPLRRQWLGKVATTVTINATPAMKDTMDIAVDMRGCADVPVDTVRVRTRGSGVLVLRTVSSLRASGSTRSHSAGIATSRERHSAKASSKGQAHPPTTDRNP